MTMGNEPVRTLMLRDDADDHDHFLYTCDTQFIEWCESLLEVNRTRMAFTLQSVPSIDELLVFYWATREQNIGKKAVAVYDTEMNDFRVSVCFETKHTGCLVDNETAAQYNIDLVYRGDSIEFITYNCLAGPHQNETMSLAEAGLKHTHDLSHKQWSSRKTHVSGQIIGADVAVLNAVNRRMIESMELPNMEYRYLKKNGENSTDGTAILYDATKFHLQHEFHHTPKEGMPQVAMAAKFLTKGNEEDKQFWVLGMQLDDGPFATEANRQLQFDSAMEFVTAKMAKYGDQGKPLIVAGDFVSDLDDHQSTIAMRAKNTHDLTNVMQDKTAAFTFSGEYPKTVDYVFVKNATVLASKVERFPLDPYALPNDQHGSNHVPVRAKLGV